MSIVDTVIWGFVLGWIEEIKILTKVNFGENCLVSKIKIYDQMYSNCDKLRKQHTFAIEGSRDG